VDLDDMLGIVVPVVPTIQVLVPDVAADPLVVETDVRRLGTGILVRAVERELDVIGVLAQILK
jgi:hypothetical protein